MPKEVQTRLSQILGTLPKIIFITESRWRQIQDQYYQRQASTANGSSEESNFTSGKNSKSRDMIKTASEIFGTDVSKIVQIRND